MPRCPVRHPAETAFYPVSNGPREREREGIKKQKKKNKRERGRECEIKKERERGIEKGF